MGTYNERCILSGLEIREGDSILALPMAFSSKSFAPSFYLVDQNKSLMCAPIISEYNGYGEFENIKNENILAFLIKLLSKDKKYFFIKNDRDEIKNSNFVYLNELIDVAFKNDKDKLYAGNFPEKESEFISEFKNIFSFRGDVFYHDFLFISLSFFNKLKERCYMKLEQDIKSNLKRMVSENYFNEKGFSSGMTKEEHNNFLLDLALQNGIEYFSEMLFLNGRSDAIREYYKIFRSFQREKEKELCGDESAGFYEVAYDNFVENLVNYSLVMHMVAGLGVTLAPPPKLMSSNYIIDSAENIKKDLGRDD